MQPRSPGVPFAVAALTLPAAADPRFKIHFSAIERWSREVCANAYADGRGFHGSMRVPKDALKPRELMDRLWKIKSTKQEDLEAVVRPIGALVQWRRLPSTSHLRGRQQQYGKVRPWEHMSLRKAPPAMIKQIMLEDRLRQNKASHAEQIARRL